MVGRSVVRRWTSVSDEARADRLLAARFAPDMSDGGYGGHADGDGYCLPATDMARLREIDATLAERIRMSAAGSAQGSAQGCGFGCGADAPRSPTPPAAEHGATLLSPCEHCEGDAGGEGGVAPHDEDCLVDVRRQKYAPGPSHGAVPGSHARELPKSAPTSRGVSLPATRQG